jgi:hypothetical protein
MQLSLALWITVFIYRNSGNTHSAGLKRGAGTLLRPVPHKKELARAFGQRDEKS